jgi:hypothetical protein
MLKKKDFIHLSSMLELEIISNENLSNEFLNNHYNYLKACVHKEVNCKFIVPFREKNRQKKNFRF